jgi:DNA gyrase subunit B/topoisomerase-4 subunit B
VGKAVKKYSAEDIEVLEGLEPVRQRPGMYIAGTDTSEGLHQLVYEIVDNCVDEAMNGHASAITVIMHSDGESITVSDNGRGIPVDKHPKFKISALELILTTLHAGGKFSDKNYKTAGGLHGVGSSVVNALSEELVATVRRDGKEYQQAFARGKPKTSLKVTNPSIRGSGTTIFFRPDGEIFAKRRFSAKAIRTTLQTKAYLNPGLSLTFVDEQANTKEEFLYQEGLVAFLREQLEQKKQEAVGGEVFLLEKEDGISVSMALCWTESTKEEFLSYANGIFTIDGGSHELGAKAAIVKAVRNYVNVHSLLPKGLKIGAEDIREGVLCLVSVKLPSGKHQAQFQGQTKSKLNNPEVMPVVESLARLLEQQLNDKPSVAEAIVGRVILSAKARAASRAAGQTVRRKIGISHRLTLPGKLADCSSIKPEDCELFIVEGDSAGGSTKQGRQRQYQAVLPLRGKVLNTIASASKGIADNKELSNIISALGCGSGDDVFLKKLRYSKVIILTDADADGMHIATLLIAFFFQHLRPLIENGHLYLGKPPLFGVFTKAKAGDISADKKNTESKNLEKRKKSETKSSRIDTARWAYSEQELENIIKAEKLSSPRITRYKGLGEMNPETLWDTTLNPKTRTLLRIKLSDEGMVRKALTELMGNDPASRFQLIQENAEKIEVDV